MTQKHRYNSEGRRLADKQLSGRVITIAIVGVFILAVLFSTFFR